MLHKISANRRTEGIIRKRAEERQRPGSSDGETERHYQNRARRPNTGAGASQKTAAATWKQSEGMWYIYTDNVPYQNLARRPNTGAGASQKTAAATRKQSEGMLGISTDNVAYQNRAWRMVRNLLFVYLF